MLKYIRSAGAVFLLGTSLTSIAHADMPTAYSNANDIQECINPANAIPMITDNGTVTGKYAIPTISANGEINSATIVTHEELLQLSDCSLDSSQSNKPVVHQPDTLIIQGPRPKLEEQEDDNTTLFAMS
ncbi:hypothetical protein [Hirschia litorea]|uniref:Uncharacterized protein n=1 Tax=Hirschia litorea TaxID=1199156 RepID=A0ABW2INZ8_9PROT